MRRVDVALQQSRDRSVTIPVQDGHPGRRSVGIFNPGRRSVGIFNPGVPLPTLRELRIMNDLHIPANNDTPEIRFAFSRHRLSMHGESYPENAMRFYGPIESSLQEYLDELAVDGQVHISIGLSYFTSSSARMIRSLLGMLDQAAANGPTISVDWLHAEDDDMTLAFGIGLTEEHGSLRFNMVAAATA